MHQYGGKLIAHTGFMFSGKASSLQREVNRSKITKYNVVVSKPKIDSKYSKEKAITHDKDEIETINADNTDDIVEYTKTHDANVIAIDEIRFINSKADHFVEQINYFLEKGFTIIAAGLDVGYKAKLL